MGRGGNFLGGIVGRLIDGVGENIRLFIILMATLSSLILVGIFVNTVVKRQASPGIERQDATFHTDTTEMQGVLPHHIKP